MHGLAEYRGDSIIGIDSTLENHTRFAVDGGPFPKVDMLVTATRVYTFIFNLR